MSVIVSAERAEVKAKKEPKSKETKEPESKETEEGK